MCAGLGIGQHAVVVYVEHGDVGLGAIAAVLILRGALFIPLIVWRPVALSGICDCGSVDAFIVVTSALCLAMGMGYALGACFAGRR